MVSEYKTCPLCKRTLLRAEWFYWRKNGARGMRWESYCKECCSQQNGAASPHYEKAKARHRDWYARNRNEQLEKTRQRQPDIYKRRLAAGYHKEASRLQRERLTDSYVKETLAHPRSGLTKAQITPELVALKREHLAVQRAKKLIHNALKERHESSKDTDRIPGQHGRGGNAGRPAADCGEQPSGAGPQGDQRHGRGSDGQVLGLDQQQP